MTRLRAQFLGAIPGRPVHEMHKRSTCHGLAPALPYYPSRLLSPTPRPEYHHTIKRAAVSQRTRSYTES